MIKVVSLMIKQAIEKVVGGTDLTLEEAMGSMEEIMSGEATGAQIGAYLAALRMKGESIDEITASARIMRDKGEKVSAGEGILDIVGTGGDCAFTFNVSTVSAIVVAAAGVRVAKHGNRSVSSKCGSADVLEALGVKITLTPSQVEAVLKKAGICFMFAQVFHKSMKYAAAPRKELGIRTIFNILGPLSNPAGADMQLLGVYDEALCEPLIRSLQNLGVKRSMAVYGRVGIDEVSLCGETYVCELKDDRINKYILTPEDFGLERYTLEELRGGDAKENADIAKKLLAGDKGPKRDMVLINSAAALYTAGIDNSLKNCVSIAAKMIDSGKAAQKLAEFVAATNEY
jgi:anthranilate phosphoribosyltransferase